jgi:hypothetical protein
LSNIDTNQAEYFPIGIRVVLNNIQTSQKMACSGYITFILH